MSWAEVNGFRDKYRRRASSVIPCVWSVVTGENSSSDFFWGDSRLKCKFKILSTVYLFNKISKYYLWSDDLYRIWIGSALFVFISSELTGIVLIGTLSISELSEATKKNT